MDAPLLATKLHRPPLRDNIVPRPSLIRRLNEGLRRNDGFGRKLTLISAPAGFGKTTLVSEWVAGCRQPVAWLSLDQGDNDPTLLLQYLIAAIQTVAPKIGEAALSTLQTPQPPPIESILVHLLNEIAAVPDSIILVLDDYHLIDSKAVDAALTFMLDHLPSNQHLVIATREDPHLPLARLRARGQSSEVRIGELRFTEEEAAHFLNVVMGLNLSAQDITALEARTEGWIAGLQLAAMSMQGLKDTAGFVRSFTGSHRFVLDYLIEEVLRQQSEGVQDFLLRTSVLERLCGPLCDAVLGARSGSGQETLEYLENANLFIIPLDNERIWYRYHHLFAEFLRQRLEKSLTPEDIAGLHVQASAWFEGNGLAFEAFRHATAANDIERAGRLMESEAIGLHLGSVATAVLGWLTSLPREVLDAHPLLWVRSATLALMAGQMSGIEQRLQSAERALQNTEPDEKVRDLFGQVACARATLALTRYDPGAMVIQARRALECLRPDNLTFRFTANWALASALNFQGDRAGAARACREALTISETSGHVFSKILATSTLGRLQELDNHLHQASETFTRSLQLSGDHPLPNPTAEVHLGLARICYEWNDLDAAEAHVQQSLQLRPRSDSVLDRFIVCEVLQARLRLARGDVGGAAELLARAEQSARRQSFLLRLPDVAAVQVPVLLRQGRVAEAAQLAGQHELPLSQASVLIAQGDPSAALALLEPLRRQMEAKGWNDERLKTMVLQTVALHAHGEMDKAVQLLGEALALAEPDGFVRIFLDEGTPMAHLLAEAAARGIMPDYAGKLLALLRSEEQEGEDRAPAVVTPPGESLSRRELEVLQLMARGLSNREIGEKLFLALDTIKGYNRTIFGKLHVQRRTEAVARAREFGLL